MFRLTIVLLVAISVLAVVGLASADSPHYGKGSPKFTDNQTNTPRGFITATGKVAGLGNEDLQITIDAVVEPTTVGVFNTGSVFSCQNPGDKDKVPGQNPTTISGSLAIPANEIKNGTLTFAVSTLQKVPGAPGCPNSSWTEAVKALAASSVTLTFKVDGGTTVVTALTRTCAPPTGGVAGSDNGQTWTC